MNDDTPQEAQEPNRKQLKQPELLVILLLLLVFFLCGLQAGRELEAARQVTSAAHRAKSGGQK